MPRALMLSVALAAIGLIAAAPASAAGDPEVVRTRVKITGVWSHFFNSADTVGRPYARYLVKGSVRSPERQCRGYRRAKELIHHPSDWRAWPGHPLRFGLFWDDHTPPFTQEHDRIKVKRWATPNGSFICKGDRSRRFTIPPPSEAHPGGQAKRLTGAGLGTPDSPAPPLTLEVGEADLGRVELRKKLRFFVATSNDSTLAATGHKLKKTTKQLAAGEQTIIRVALKKRLYGSGACIVKIKFAATDELGQTATDAIKLKIIVGKDGHVIVIRRDARDRPGCSGERN